MPINANVDLNALAKFFWRQVKSRSKLFLLTVIVVTTGVTFASYTNQKFRYEENVRLENDIKSYIDKYGDVNDFCHPDYERARIKRAFLEARAIELGRQDLLDAFLSGGPSFLVYKDCSDTSEASQP